MNTESTWFAILVIALGVLLALFLILSIVLIIKAVQVVNSIKKITVHAEQVADKAEHMAAFFEKTTTPVAFMKLVANVSEVIQKKAKK